MTKDVGRDEQMYCTAGALLAQGQSIYRDFSYPSQLPYHPLLLAALYRGLGTTHFLLVGRLVSVTCDILVLFLILLIYRSVFGPHRLAGLLFGLAAVTLYVFNPLVDYAVGYAWNHDVVILCVAASLGLFLTADLQHRSRFWRTAAMGLLLTLATCMRVTTALVELLFLAAILWTAGGSFGNRIRTALPFFLATLVVMVWPLWVIAQAPQAFWLNLVRIPALYGRWLHEIGMVYDKVSLTRAALLTPGYLMLLLLAGLAFWFARRGWPSLDVTERRKAAVTVLLPLVFFLIAYLPPTMWQQYLAVPVPFLAIALAYPLLVRRREAESRPPRYLGWGAALLAPLAAVVIAILAYPLVLQRSMVLLIPEQWTPVAFHRTSVKIAAEIQEPKLVLTLGPLHALEGGCDIYPELSCGSIVYRVADLLSGEERQITHTVGPKTLGDLVTARPPSAVIVGVEPPYFSFLEDPFRKLVPPDWRRETYADTLQVYRPR